MMNVTLALAILLGGGDVAPTNVNCEQVSDPPPGYKPPPRKDGEDPAAWSRRVRRDLRDEQGYERKKDEKKDGREVEGDGHEGKDRGKKGDDGHRD